jgi:hypothetical protein
VFQSVRPSEIQQSSATEFLDKNKKGKKKIIITWKQRLLFCNQLNFDPKWFKCQLKRYLTK